MMDEVRVLLSGQIGVSSYSVSLTDPFNDWISMATPFRDRSGRCFETAFSRKDDLDFVLLRCLEKLCSDCDLLKLRLNMMG